MSDDAEMWRAVRADEKQEREKRYAKETALLAVYSNELTVVARFNGGIHWRVRNGHGITCDLWPSTGKWRVVGDDTVRTGGVESLRRHKTPPPPKPLSLTDRVQMLRLTDGTVLAEGCPKFETYAEVRAYNQAITDVLALFAQPKGKEGTNGES